MLTGIQNVIRPAFSYFQENALSSLKYVDRRIAAVALVIFALIVTSLIFLKTFWGQSKRKDEVQDRSADGRVESNPAEDAGKNNTASVKNEDTPEVIDEPSKIPSISGYRLMLYERDACNNLFEILYAKQFYDSEDSKTAQIIDAFAKHVQDGEYGKDITVNIYKDDNPPEDIKEELIKEGCVFHIHTNHHRFGSSTYREIAISSAFFESLRKLPQMPCSKENFTDEHKKLLKSIVLVMAFALYKVNKNK